ncbi:hypothetical protein ACP4OV_004122 [Aristida adscensionis]
MATTTADVTTAAAAAFQRSAASPAPPARDVNAERLLLLEEMTTNVDAVQERVLAEILGRNAGATEYLRNCGLAAGADRAAFRAKVPLATYEDLRPYIRRMADGDRSPILSGWPVYEFLTSSGTSGGESKLVPMVEDELDRRQLLYSLLVPVMSQYVPGLEKGKGLFFLFIKPEMNTPAGIPARTVLTSYYKSNQFKDRACDTYHTCTSPMEAILCTDTFQSMYVQMLCGLWERHDVLRVGAVFGYGLVQAIRFFQRNWEQLAADIGAGELNPRVTDASVLEAVAGFLRPHPELAEFIRKECSTGDWAGIITRIWPNAKYLDTIVTGSMAQYAPTLNYYSGGLPIASVAYGASECEFGLNLHPMCDPSEVSYTILPTMAYFEFLPLDAATAADDEDAGVASHHQLVDLARVEAGREYELVVTTYSGLSRYRVGDVLRATGFHNAAPQFRFVRRRSTLLSVGSTSANEAELQRAVERASALLGPRGAAVADYTCRSLQACTGSTPGHYVVYWELLVTTTDKAAPSAMADGATLERCCLEMEEALNAAYRRSRATGDGSVGPLEIRVLRSGTFERLMDYAVSRGASVGQYKVPRCVVAPAMIELLDSHVISSHFSPALPRWAPDQRLDSAGEECSA